MAGPPSVELYPSGPVHAASARLRGIGLARELQRLGCAVSLGAPGPGLPDVLIVQKTSSDAIVARARAVRAAGGHVIFDIDDWGDALPWAVRDPRLLRDLLAECSAVSVDTLQRAEVFRQDPAYAALPAFWVVPDPVDYVDGSLPALANDAGPQGRAGGRLSGCWFGNGPNLPPALPFVQAALSTDRLSRFGIITNSQFVAQLQQAYPMLAVEAWQLESFAARLRDHDFCLLVHDTGTEGLQKSNNKMLAALAQGVVPLVSNTPAYAETAALIGVPELVFDSPEDLRGRIDAESIAALRGRIRSPDCLDVLARWLPATVARDYLARLQDLRAAPSAARLAASTAIETSAPAAPVRLNLGEADLGLPGYVHVELPPPSETGSAIEASARGLAAYPDGSVDEVMAIHLVQRFHRSDVVGVLKAWVRVLKPGGRLVLESPNLITACEALVADPGSAARPGANGSRAMECLYGDPGDADRRTGHRWLYTPLSLAEVMHEAGLRQLAQQLPEFKARHPQDMRVVGLKPAD